MPLDISPTETPTQKLDGYQAYSQACMGIVGQQADIILRIFGKISQLQQSNLDMNQGLLSIYKEMLNQHKDPMSHLSTQGEYQVFMTGQKARKQVLETSLEQLQMMKGVDGYLFPYQQRLENYIRTNLAFTFTFDRPDYNVPNTIQETIHEGERMDIIKFSPESIEKNGESIFLIAPISGHFPTLLRKTVQGLTDTGYEVYLTDWKSCLQMNGKTQTKLDDYTKDLADAYAIIPGQIDALAVCQPGPITLSSIALAEKNGTKTPRSVTVMASPLDTRVNPTKVGEVGETMSPAVLHSAQLVSPKSGKKVYPGTYQINNFIAANLERHLKKFTSLAMSDEVLNIEQEKTLAFYHEYFAVMDIPYDFFCETIQRVFQDREWATGKVSYKDEVLDLSSLQTPVCVIEGGKDDICGIGETKAAFDITGQTETEINYLLCEDAGHYGVFAGKDFRNEVIPFMKRFRASLAA